ncbi:hypothetical protein AZE42_00811 [Rhizopogon vesiculosus]|uniref:FAR-17a/AIG1-like protein n=1 Tax=Rhizopogon vesiculosus TaxID=180088 RepID=A0A1J8Q2E4_9AGAM|nr:hypothetical protein AZE42_00811 [Rhizopogon vesiculosus]
MPRPEALLLHGAALSVMTYGFLSLKTLPLNDWIKTQTGGHFQFLTIQGLAAAWLTMAIGIGCDLLPSFTALRTAKRAFLMISLPVEIVLSGVYWSLVLFFPSLILQPQMATSEPSSSSTVPGLLHVPLNVDLSLHVAPVVTLLADFLLFEKKYTKKQVQIGAPLVAFLAGTWYACWVEYCASYNKTFPYPFLTDNPLNIRIGIYASVSFIAWRCFRLVNAIHR